MQRLLLMSTGKLRKGLLRRLPTYWQAESRKSNSYLFTGGTTEDLMKTLDPDWPGGIPHTVLVDANGTILWRHNGAVNGDELRAKVLERLGTVYQP